ncbi:MAG TPA: 2,3-bisphosphoglycerate-independent phosphoglycerate mutase [Kiritimatiellia bacterium]|nr:2,3-bisphosphoglycerate-independent phosphoglycerate mutase [Kiritimatiellia bacterium]
MKAMQPIPGYQPPRGPVVLAIMDGVGLGKFPEGDMVAKATKPTWDWLKEHALYTTLKAHGTAVGMPSDEDMGNSEVGHNAIGAGRVFAQGAKLVEHAINDRVLFEGETWKALIANSLERKSALHFIGLLSDGNVHSHIRHLLAMIREAKAAGVATVRVHTLLDGRDVPPSSAHEYLATLEELLAECSADGADYAIASGGGRQVITMDRYEADWEMIAKGWDTHVRGKGPEFPNALAAVEAYRAEKPGIIDQDLPPFVVVRDGKPVGPIVDGDSVILCNFRGDRAIELCRAFEEEPFDKFDRGPKPKVMFAGMMEYDGDLHIPSRFLVAPPALDRTMGEYLTATGLNLLAVSETQKYGHVTYFFNGNRSGKFNDALEDYVEIKSDRLPFEQRPWMKASEITDVALESIRTNRHKFIRINYPNGDMVGHTGDPLAVEISVEATDLNVGRLVEAIQKAEGILVLSADHGNADEMFERNKKGEVVMDPRTGKPKAKTSHTLNPVPCFIYDPSGRAKARLVKQEGLGISSLAATCITLLGYQPPEDYTPSVVEVG